MRLLALLLALSLTSCTSIQLAQYHREYPNENGRCLVNNGWTSPAQFKRKRDGALVFMGLVAFAVVGLEMYSESQYSAIVRRGDANRGK